MSEYFSLAAKLARDAWHTKEPPIHKALEATQLLEAAIFLCLAAKKLLANGELDKTQHESMLTWFHCAEEWLPTSGYAASDRAAMRRSIRAVVENRPPRLELVPRSEDALTEIAENADPRD